MDSLGLAVMVPTWLAVGLILYHHLGYPLILRLAGSFPSARDAMPPAPLAESDLPPLTVVVPAYNEAAVIAAKLANLAALDYPADRLRVIVASDGSTDGTAEITADFCANHPDFRCELMAFTRNRGKVAVLNQVLPQIQEGLVCLTDASALLNPEAGRIAAAHFAAASGRRPVGVVAATYRFAREGTAGEAAYWRYQTEVKRRESRLGGVIGVHGAGWFYRASLFEPLAGDTINDDFILPMRMVWRGYRAIYEPTIIATELERVSLATDQRRRRRIAAGNMQQALRLIGMITPSLGGVAFCFFSGKVLRAFSPFLMVLALVGASLGTLLGLPLALPLFVAQAVLYSLAVPKALAPGRRWPRPVELVHYLVAGHMMGLIGGWRYLIGRERGRWHRLGPGPAASLPDEFTHLSPTTELAKRVFDVIGALIGLAIALVLVGPIVLAIRLSSPGPIIYRQLRIGRSLPDRTVLFVMMKFRTMYVDAEARSGPVWARRNDPRITPVGRFLRKTRLDEIPQLINVLRGEMSLVGPRPERPGITERLEDAIPFFAERTYGVRPGITGLAQVNQGYDESLDDVRAKVLYDHAYGLAIMSFWGWFRTDLGIIWRTLAVVLTGRGQ